MAIPRRIAAESLESAAAASRPETYHLLRRSSVHMTIALNERPDVARRGFVAYFRVSTAAQGRSGLGLEAQRQAVQAYLNSGRGTLVAEHTEIESGNHNDRPELLRALATCRLHKATLVVAKLDRLSRNAAFLLTLRDAGSDFVAVDMPDANRMTVGIMAVVAEHEREAISARTKAALAAAKARGVVLGNPANLSAVARRSGNSASAAVRRSQAKQRALDLAVVLAELRAEGRLTLRALAEGLNHRAIPAPRGGQWNPAQVRRLVIGSDLR